MDKLICWRQPNNDAKKALSRFAFFFVFDKNTFILNTDLLSLAKDKRKRKFEIRNSLYTLNVQVNEILVEGWEESRLTESLLPIYYVFNYLLFLKWYQGLVFCSPTERKGNLYTLKVFPYVPFWLFRFLFCTRSKTLSKPTWYHVTNKRLGRKRTIRSHNSWLIESKCLSK